MSVRIARPRTIVAKEKPLSIEEAALACPAIITKEAGPTVMAGYQRLDTESLIRQFEALGYGISQVNQERSNSWQDAYAKHMVRMRPLKKFTPRKDRKVGDSVEEAVIVNAHNGSSKLHVLVGIWRFVCTNGLMTGDTISGFHYRHTGAAREIANAVVEQMAKKVLPQLEALTSRMHTTRLNQEGQLRLANDALRLRWGFDAPVQAEMLLNINRPEDKGDSVWHVYNRIQENVLRGGFTEARRNAAVRPLENVTRVVNVNRSLWDAAASFVM